MVITYFLLLKSVRDDVMKKRFINGIFSLIWIFVILCSNVLQTFAINGDEIRASKKIISVVYDDSGSMCGERWSYTDYAMQALIALLNEQDELYITFMSDPFTAVPMDTSDLSATIKKSMMLHAIVDFPLRN